MQKPQHSPREVDKIEVSLSTTQVNLIALAVGVAGAAILLGAYLLLWSGKRITLTPLTLAVLVVTFIAGFGVHELLHGLGFLALGGAPRSAIKVGFQAKAMMPYCHCAVPITASAYRAAIVLPGIVLGVLPGAAGVLLGDFWLTLWGVGMLSGAGGDLAMAWGLRAVPGGAQVVDHPTEVKVEISLDEPRRKS